MAKYKAADLSRIGNTIRAVAQAESVRYFKAEANYAERSAFVSVVITATIFVALIDGGVAAQRLLDGEIDPTEDVMEAMGKAGYVLIDAPGIQPASIVD